MPRNGESTTSARRLAAVERQRLALGMRRGGASYDDIARKLGYAGPNGAHKAVLSAIRKTLAEPADDVRLLELDRLDRLQLAYWTRATGDRDRPPDLAAAHYVLKLMDRRARLLGLDAPIKIDVRALVREITTRHDLSDDESRVLYDDLTAYLDAQRTGV
jgi:hypothetical protein